MPGLLKSKNKPFNILAIDIGTASVSAALAAKENGKKADVKRVFRYHYDALAQTKSKSLIDSVSKAFKDAHKFEKSISLVRIGFSSPFFIEQSLLGEAKRQDPKIEISSDEVEKLMFSRYAGLPRGLDAVSCELVSSKVDGYEVQDPVGYGGEVLAVEAKVLAISGFLKSKIEELKNEFFPSSEMSYVSDHDILRKLASAVYSKSFPAVLDIGGEVSILNSESLPFGIRSFERKLASFFNFGLQEAENMLRRLSLGTLDYYLERAVNRIMRENLFEWLELMKEKFNSVKNQKNLFISGAGADFHVLTNAIKENLKNLYNLNMNVEVLAPEAFKEKFIHLGTLSGGKDAVLTALILAYE